MTMLLLRNGAAAAPNLLQTKVKHLDITSANFDAFKVDQNKIREVSVQSFGTVPNYKFNEIARIWAPIGPNRLTL